MLIIFIIVLKLFSVFRTFDSTNLKIILFIYKKNYKLNLLYINLGRKSSQYLLLDIECDITLDLRGVMFMYIHS